MRDHPPVPATIWKRLLLFLQDNRSGTITFHVRGGQVRNAVISEQVPAHQPEKEVKSRVLESW
jgi:hypothetical protein